MQDINLPRHVVEALGRKWAQKLQEQAAVWRTTKPPVCGRADAGPIIDHRIRRLGRAATLAGSL